MIYNKSLVRTKHTFNYYNSNYSQEMTSKVENVGQ